MNKILFFLSLVFATTLSAQTFPGPPSMAGTTAIRKDSSCFVGWATGGTIVKGYLDINDTTAEYEDSNKPTFGQLDYAFGPAQGNITNVVSLGDSGVVTLTFGHIITNGSGFDFAVFENGFTDGYMELAHVEVSSDGVNFFRFPSTTEISTATQYNNGTIGDCREVNNLAGKYRNGFGTPFDLTDVPDNLLLNKNAVTHVKIIDAVGSIGAGGSNDQFGTRINDPYPTVFPSGGFDLDAVGVINGYSGLDEKELQVKLWPNPAKDKLSVELTGEAAIFITDLSGKTMLHQSHFDVSIIHLDKNLPAGVYLVQVISEKGIAVERLVIE